MKIQSGSCLHLLLQLLTDETSDCTHSFVHGGAWRDPSQDKAELQPALAQLLSTPDSHTLKHIAGFASINYGLSTYAPEDEAQDPSLRVTHPHHIADVVLALSYLHQKYKVGATHESGGYDFVIVGHSAGATLAFQTLTHKCDCVVYRPVRAVVGLAGIYNLPLMVANHTEEPFYRKFVSDAFGTNEKVWQDVSPALRKYEEARGKGGLEVAILGASEGDVLVEKAQWESMRLSLEEQGWKSVETGSNKTREGEARKEIVSLQLEGTHDEMWQHGNGVRKGIELVIEKLFRPPS